MMDVGTGGAKDFRAVRGTCRTTGSEEKERQGSRRERGVRKGVGSSVSVVIGVGMR
jgi:hypothetical protein